MSRAESDTKNLRHKPSGQPGVPRGGLGPAHQLGQKLEAERALVVLGLDALHEFGEREELKGPLAARYGWALVGRLRHGPEARAGRAWRGSSGGRRASSSGTL